MSASIGDDAASGAVFSRTVLSGVRSQLQTILTFWTHTAEMARNVNQPGKADQSDPFYHGATMLKQGGHPNFFFLEKGIILRRLQTIQTAVSFHVPMFGGGGWGSHDTQKRVRSGNHSLIWGAFG